MRKEMKSGMKSDRQAFTSGHNGRTDRPKMRRICTCESLKQNVDIIMRKELEKLQKALDNGKKGKGKKGKKGKKGRFDFNYCVGVPYPTI